MCISQISSMSRIFIVPNDNRFSLPFFRDEESSLKKDASALLAGFRSGDHALSD